MHQKTNKKDNNTVLDTSRIVKQKNPNWNALPNSENENSTLPNSAQPSNHKKTISQEQKMNLENEGIILNSENNYFTIIKNHRMQNT